MRFGNSDGCRDTVVSTIYGFDYRMVGGLCGKAVVRKIEILKGAYKKKIAVESGAERETGALLRGGEEKKEKDTAFVIFVTSFR